MVAKAFALIFAAVMAGAFFFGGFSGSAYSRDVARPMSVVREGLADLDITAQPGAPGTDPSRSGGVAPVFRLATTDNTMTWYVMSGDKVAVTMTALLEPIDGGKGTRVTTEVVRGDAPDDFVSPAFRSVGITTGLFNLAVEDELNDLTMPAAADPATCDKLMERFRDENLSDVDMQTQTSASDASADVAKTVVRLNAMEAELRRNGCQIEKGYKTRSATSVMARSAPEKQGEQRPIDPASFSAPTMNTASDQ